MQRERLDLTEEDGYEALRGHVLERALLGRDRYGPGIGEGELRKLLEDRDVVRFPVRIGFDEAQLLPGEFAWARALGERPVDGYVIEVAPQFRDRPDDLVAIVAYHLVRVNYLDVATHVEAELFGAALLGLEIEEYYQRLCALADELPEPVVREALSPADIDQAVTQAMGASPVGASAGASGCGPSSCGGCSCGG